MLLPLILKWNTKYGKIRKISENKIKVARTKDYVTQWRIFVVTHLGHCFFFLILIKKIFYISIKLSLKSTYLYVVNQNTFISTSLNCYIASIIFFFVIFYCAILFSFWVFIKGYIFFFVMDCFVYRKLIHSYLHRFTYSIK